MYFFSNLSTQEDLLMEMFLKIKFREICMLLVTNEPDGFILKEYIIL